MEQYTHSENKPAYGWLAAAAVATLALCAATHLNLPPLTAEGDGIGAALSTLGGFFLRTLLVVPLLAVTPALWARSAWRSHPFALGLLSLIAFGTGLWLTQSPLEGAFDLGLIAPAGVLLYALQRMKSSNFRVVLYGSFALLLGLFLRISVPTMLTDGDAFLPMRELVTAYRVIWDEGISDPMTQRMMEMMGTPVDTVGTYLVSLKLNAEEYLIELLYYPAAIAALINCLLSHLFNRRGGAELVKLPPFPEWQIENAYFYGALAFTLIAYVISFSGVSYGMALVRIGYAVWLLPMSLAGLCTLKRWTVGRTWLFALACVATALMYSVLGQMLAIVGMIGFLQKRMRDRMEGGRKE